MTGKYLQSGTYMSFIVTYIYYDWNISPEDFLGVA